jgi:hypothetical protein
MLRSFGICAINLVKAVVIEHRLKRVTLSRYPNSTPTTSGWKNTLHHIHQVSAYAMTMAPDAIPLPLTPASSEDQELVRNYIDSVLVEIVHQLSLSPSEAQPSITLRRRPRQATCMINPRNGALEAGPSKGAYSSYSWPGSTAHESWKFSKETFFRYNLVSCVVSPG